MTTNNTPYGWKREVSKPDITKRPLPAPTQPEASELRELVKRLDEILGTYAAWHGDLRMFETENGKRLKQAILTIIKENQ